LAPIGVIAYSTNGILLGGFTQFITVHHSSKRLYFLNATRFHFIDLCLAGLASAIRLALCGASAEIVVLVNIFTGLHGNWQHANARYRLGWLNWIFLPQNCIAGIIRLLFRRAIAPTVII
jgi:hypothetical protein